MEAVAVMRKDEVVTELAAEGLSVAGVVERAGEDEVGFFVYVPVVRDKSGKQSPSNHKLKKIRNSFSERCVVLEFLLTDEVANDIESGLRATLLFAYPDAIRNSFMSLDSSNAHVWIDPKPNAVEHLEKIDSTVRSYLKKFKLSLVALAFTVDENLPTGFSMLRLLRIFAPVSLGVFSSKLQERKFTIPSEDWLRRKLDGLRKKGLVVWLKGEGDQPHGYALSLKALRGLGTDKKRSSADITRLLAIARSYK